MAAESDVTRCPHEESCGGCDYLSEPYSQQKSLKISQLENLLRTQGIRPPAVEFLSPGLTGLRDRLDFVLEEGRFGLSSPSERRIVDLLECGQLSPGLAAWLREFRDNRPAVRRGSVRLRVAPDGTKGMWLDFANVDLKTLLDDSAWLHSWDSQVVIEAGQRRKRVDRSSARPKLLDPVLFPWFQTRWQNQVVPLYGAIGSFTQPGLRSNEMITAWMQKEIKALNPRHIVEFGSGQGNLSFPALSVSTSTLTACETDRLALTGFQMSLGQLAGQGHDLRDRIKLEAGDFLRKPADDFLSADLLLVNPPRSGLKKFLDPLPQAKALKSAVYMSCHPESFAEDVPRFTREGFHLEKLTILDQFPQTKHYEVLAILRK